MSKNSVSFLPVPIAGLPLPPLGQGAGINAKFSSRVLLANAQDTTQLDDSYPKAPAFIRERYMSEELNHSRDEM